VVISTQTTRSTVCHGESSGLGTSATGQGPQRVTGRVSLETSFEPLYCSCLRRVIEARAPQRPRFDWPDLSVAVEVIKQGLRLCTSSSEDRPPDLEALSLDALEVFTFDEAYWGTDRVPAQRQQRLVASVI
jgi:hypothetical protein